MLVLMISTIETDIVSVERMKEYSETEQVSHNIIMVVNCPCTAVDVIINIYRKLSG